MPSRIKIKTIRAILSVALAAFVGSCSPQNSSPRLYVMDCGYVNLSEVSGFGLSNEDTSVREMFVPCYLIQHKGKSMLWDAGLPLAMVGAGKVKIDTMAGAYLQYDVSLIDQLAAIGITPEQVDYIALSHLHFDHVGAANLFAGSTWLVQRSEHEAAFGETAFAAFRPEFYSALQTAQTKLLDGDYDVFGDGKVKLISAPGHTPGHMVLALDMKQTGKLVLSGDLYHFQKSRVLKSVPLFNHSAGNTLEAMDKVEALIKETGATLWIEHDMELARTLKKAPDFYQ
jgi:N-acyl homoserine lactone hydrolase